MDMFETLGQFVVTLNANPFGAIALIVFFFVLAYFRRNGR